MRVVLLSLVLFGSLASPAAAAVTLEEGLGAVRATVDELPKIAPPPAPELPVASPPRPIASSDQDGAASKSPAESPRPRSAPSGASEAGPPEPIAGSVDRTVSAVETAAGQGDRALPRPASPVPQVDRTGSDLAPRSDARAGPGFAGGRPGPGARSLRPAVAAPLRELLAHVWPAIALGPIGGVLLGQAEALVPVLLPDAPGLTRSFQSSDAAGTPGGPSPMPAAQTARPDSDLFFLPHSGGMSFLAAVVMVLASLVGVVALARLTVGEDFFSLRWLR